MIEQDSSDLAATGADDRSAPTERSVRSWARPARSVTIFCLPALVFIALGVRPLEPLNGQDGYLYTGMVPRMYDFMNRFPDAYYGVRFGYTIPTWLATKLLGFEAGYLVLRWAAVGVLCVLLTRSLRMRSALLATALISASPILLVAVLNTYTLSIGVLAFVLACGVLATTEGDGRVAEVRVAAAGGLFAIAWNTHLVALAISLAVGLVFVTDRAREVSVSRIPSTARSIALLGSGAALVTAIGMVVYGVRFGTWDVYGPTIEQARRPTDDFYLEPGFRWVSWRHYLWVGPLAVAAGALAWKTEANPTSRMVLRRLTVSTGSTLGIFAIFQWLMDDPLLATYFYSALPLSLGVATIAVAAGAAVSRQEREGVHAVVIATLAFASLVLGARVGGAFAVLSVIAVLVLALSLAIGARVPQFVSASTAFLVVAASWMTVSSPHDFRATPGGFRTDPYYDSVLFSYDWSALDRAQLVDEFARALPSLPDQRGAIRIWFDRALPYDQLSAPLAWQRSSLTAPDDPSPPTLSVFGHAALVDDRPRFVVVVDGQAPDVSGAIEQITAAAPYTVIWERPFVEGDLVAYAALLERAPGTWPDFPCRVDGIAQACP